MGKDRASINFAATASTASAATTSVVHASARASTAASPPSPPADYSQALVIVGVVWVLCVGVFALLGVLMYRIMKD